MIGDRTSDGWEIRLKTRDPGRFFGAGFLAVWLCGWAVGEALVLWLLVRGAHALWTGGPPDPGRAPLEAGPAIGMGAFLLVWVTLWTVGGFAALAELARLLWGEDRIEVTGGRLTATWLRGPFGTRRTFERGTIRSIALAPPRDTLTIDAGTKHYELSRLGTRDERAEAATALRSLLALPAMPSIVLPDAWEAIVTPEGHRAIVPNLGVRRTQARLAGVVALCAAAGTIVIVRDVARDPRLWALALMAIVATAALAAGWNRLARGRQEWRIGSGRVTLCRRSGTHVQELFEGRRLVLDSTSDSDGDLWYDLLLVGEGDEPAGPSTVAATWLPSRPKNSRSIVRRMNEPAVVKDLAAWLARESGVELEDRTTPAAQAVDLARLREALEQSGQLGRWSVKLLDRIAKKAP